MKKFLIYLSDVFFNFSICPGKKIAKSRKIFSFNATVKNLNYNSGSEISKYIQDGTWILLDGSLSSLTLLSGRGEEYLLEALLVQGEWKNLDEVIKYEARLIFQGDEWANVVPSRTPREIKEGMILLNSHVLVLGRIVSFERTADKIIPYLMVDKIRIIP